MFLIIVLQLGADKSGRSFIYSPLSITYVLGMVNDAATGKTEQELEQTLGFHEGGIKAVNEYCKKLMPSTSRQTGHRSSTLKVPRPRPLPQRQVAPNYP